MTNLDFFIYLVLPTGCMSLILLFVMVGDYLGGRREKQRHEIERQETIALCELIRDILIETKQDYEHKLSDISELKKRMKIS